MDGDNTVRTAAYEVLNTFVASASVASVHTVANLSEVILKRLEDSTPLRHQVVSVEDRLKLDEIQTSLSSVIMVA